MPNRKYNYIGETFGRLLVLREDEGVRPKRYICQCDCGNIKSVRATSLAAGHVKSCGCLSKDANAYRNVSKRKQPGEAASQVVYYYYKRNATKRGIEFALTREECMEFFSQCCSYCGVEPTNSTHKRRYYGEFLYNGIDRVDSAKGYTLDNVVSCCRNCNHAKRDLSRDDFLSLIERIYKHSIEGKEK